jgi:membrane protease YdiL (CAAX protease family)
VTKSKLIIAAALEVSYAIVTRTWLRQHFEGVPLELAVSACRVVTIIAYWALFRDLIQSRVKAPSTLRHPVLGAGVALALLVPCLFQGWSPGGGVGTALVFVLTSVIVGFREELLYRAVLQNLLQARLGTAGALLGTTAIFVIYHYGAQPMTWLAVTEIAGMSLLLGLIYIRSGSLLAVTAIHSAYDGIWFLGPFLNPVLPDAWRPAFHVPALVLVLAWWRFCTRRSRAHMPSANARAQTVHLKG